MELEDKNEKAAVENTLQTFKKLEGIISSEEKDERCRKRSQ